MTNLTEDQLQELLGRPFDIGMLDVKHVTGKSVMVTGAGGSIGSALVMQLIALKPETLILYEANEYALYRIEAQARALMGVGRIVPMLGTLTYPEDLAKALRAFYVDRVYHAAAYKHVPMVERNPVAGIRNNVFATNTLVEACTATCVPELLFVSTDKAVRPTNIMGCTKRIAEYIVLNAGYKVVRFGNVLGSTGSVIPLFASQITAGVPMTLTHPNVTRYFMSVREAVGLMLKAETTGCDICVLDMGVQIRIADMAQRLAKMMGRWDRMLQEPYPMGIVGLRPGEKLYEELTLGESVKETKIPHVLCASEDWPKASMHSLLEALAIDCMSGDIASLRQTLKASVPGYEPSCGIMDDVWLQGNVLNAELDDCFTAPEPPK